MFNSSGSLPELNLTYAYEKDISQMQQRILDNSLTNVTYKNNKFSFTSNTEGKKLIVTNIPYDTGWTLKANGKVKETFIVNGGFIGFISEDGETNYTLSYFTPYLKEGLIGTILGIMLLIAVCFIYRNKKVDVHLIETKLALRK